MSALKPCSRAECPNYTTNPKYCSITCVALVNNRVGGPSGKKAKIKFCKKCNNPYTGKSKFCKGCRSIRILKRPQESSRLKCFLCSDASHLSSNCCLACLFKEYESIEKIPLSNLRIKEGLRVSLNVRVRDHARRKMKAFYGDLKCFRCGYNLHCEIAHIKPTTSFPDDSLLSEVNDLNNLVPLCRNCHWELDHGILSVTQGDKKNKIGINFFEFKQLEKRSERKLKPNWAPRKTQILKKCYTCGTETYNKKYCSYSCGSFALRIVERPDKETLLREISESNFLSLSKKYGVSDNAVRKWCKNYGIDPKTKKPME